MKQIVLNRVIKEIISILTIIADQIKLSLSSVKIKSKLKWFIEEHIIEENKNKLNVDESV